MEPNAINGFLPIYRAYRACMLGKDDNITALKYHHDAVSKCMDLAARLQRREWEVGAYYPFEVYEPKHRLVLAIDFEGKVVQHSLCDNALYPALARRVILDNYASQTGKGTHFGLDRLTKNLRHYFFSRKAADEAARRAAGLPRRPMGEWRYAEGWVLKGDFHHYFYTLRHDVAKAVSAKALAGIADVELRDYAIWLLDLFIDSTPDPGIPIGNQSSQLIALLYLDWMDHWLTDGLGLTYGRYMDDFYVIHEDREYLTSLVREIDGRIRTIGLSLNPKTQVFPLKNGIDFLGFHSYLTDTGKVVRKLRAKSITNMRRRLKKYRRLVDEGRMTLEAVDQSFGSWKAHAAHGDGHHVVHRMEGLFNELFPELEARHAAKAKRARDRGEDQVPHPVRRQGGVAGHRAQPA